MKRFFALLFAAALVFVIYCAATGYRPAWLEPYWHAPVDKANQGRRFRNPDEAVSVLVAPVRKADVPVTVDAIGTAVSLNQVVVRSQVDGRLTEVLFKDGQDVKKGDVLARIDATTFQAQFDQASAKKAQDEAQLANARKDLERYQTLASTQYTSRQQADTQAATVAQLQALIGYDEASLANARAILDYTTIKAPIDGRAGFRAVDPGNIIHASDTAGLVTLTQLKPIGINFNLPQQHLRAALAARNSNALSAIALDADSAGELDRGLVTTIDNQVDASTGSVKFRGEFPNSALQLWPGQFVNVRLTLSVLRAVLTVPTPAVQRGPNGAFLYGAADGKASVIPVTVTHQDETLAVVEGRLEAGQNIITTGFARLKDGAKITIAESPAAAPDAPGNTSAAPALATSPAAPGPSDAPVAAQTDPATPNAAPAAGAGQNGATDAPDQKKRRKKDGTWTGRKQDQSAKNPDSGAAQGGNAPSASPAAP